jgi:GNAT superfamily N-acetyltransferase
VPGDVQTACDADLVRFSVGVFEQQCGDYVISDDPDRVVIDVIHRYLADESYWARGRTRTAVRRSVSASLIYGAYAANGDMVGSARVVTDGATFAWLCDVFVLEDHRGYGLGKAMVAAATDRCRADGLGRVVLATADAHVLYEQCGFRRLASPDMWMELTPASSAGP